MSLVTLDGSVITIGDRQLVCIVEDGAPEEEWQDGRAEGVTASEIHDIARGSRKAWRSLLDAKLNGSTFNGNRHTRRGHAAEPFILAEARKIPGVVMLARSSALYANAARNLDRATPDGLGISGDLGDFGFEAKDHDSKWTRTDIPNEHLDQMQWGMHVLGFDWWLYAWHVEGEEDIHYEWVPRDDARIAVLVRQADAFIEWREAGAPEIDDIPDEIDDHLAAYARAQRAESIAKKVKGVHGDALKKWAVEQEAQPGVPLRRAGSRAGLFFEPKTTVVLDEEAWAAAEPLSYAEWVETRDRVEAQREAAFQLYRKTESATPTFRVNASGETKA